MASANLSKRAFELADIAKHIASIWHDYEGPMENVFRILSYLIPFVPGLGWGIFVLESIATFFGYGMSDLGAAIDRAAGFKPGQPVREKTFLDSATSVLEGFFTRTAESNTDMVKLASLAAVMKLVGGIPRALGLVWQAVKFILLAFGLSNLGEIYTSATGQKKKPGEIYLSNEEVKDKADKLLTTEQVGKLVDVVQDPAALTRLFI